MPYGPSHGPAIHTTRPPSLPRGAATRPLFMARTRLPAMTVANMFDISPSAKAQVSTFVAKDTGTRPYLRKVVNIAVRHVKVILAGLAVQAPFGRPPIFIS